MSGGVPAHSLDAEATVLSTLALCPHFVPQIRLAVQPADFYDVHHRFIAEAAYRLDDAGRAIDLKGLISDLDVRGLLDAAGGRERVLEVIDYTPAVHNALEHAAVVAQLARVRAVEDAARVICGEARGPMPDAMGWIQSAAERLLAATNHQAGRITYGTAYEAATQAETELRSLKGVAGLSTGFRALDRQCGGLPVGLSIAAGRPGMGKTAFALCLARNVARSGKGVAFVSAEMTLSQLGSRLVSLESGLDNQAMEQGKLSPQQWETATAARERIKRLPIVIDAADSYTVPSIRATIRLLQQQLDRQFNGTKLGLVVVDYVQLVNAKGDNREQQVAAVSKGLLALARQLQVPVLALAQLNRGSDSRFVKDHRPKLTDLRESGQLEQDAARVFGLYREEYYDENTPDRGIAEVLVLKCRQGGQVGTVRLAFRGSTMEFAGLESPSRDGFEDEFDSAL